MNEAEVDIALTQSLKKLSKLRFQGRMQPSISIPAIDADLETHLRTHICELSRLLVGGAIENFEFVRVYAGDHATHQIPIESTMQAYRDMHPALCQWLHAFAGKPRGKDHESVRAELEDFARQYISAISIIYASAYAAHAAVFAVAEGDRRTKLLSILLEGFDEGDNRIVRFLKQAGYLE
jgi:hypothetical protein